MQATSGQAQAAEISPRGRCSLFEGLTRRTIFIQVIDIPSHSSLEDRIELARRMKEEMKMDSKVEVLVDNMEDAFNNEFAAWPIRYYIAKEGRLLHKTENSINNDLFDQVSLQNFFRGFGFVRAPDPDPDRESSLADLEAMYAIRMAHRSSTGDLATRANCCLIVCSSAAPLVFALLSPDSSVSERFARE